MRKRYDDGDEGDGLNGARLGTLLACIHMDRGSEAPGPPAYY